MIHFKKLCSKIIGEVLKVFFCGFDVMFEISPRMFNWVEIWGIGGKIYHFSTSTFNEIFDVISPMPRSIIHDDNHPLTEMFLEVRFNPFHKNLLVNSMVIGVCGKKLIIC